jgi:hypothetical protein
MSSNYNIDELKYLLADHITGQISEEDKKAVDKALLESEELRNLYQEMSSALQYISDVKFEDPSPQYWSSLLPRIHQKIEERENKSFSWGKIALTWKILIPAAAVLLIAVIYYLAGPVDPGITKDDNIKEQINTDTSREQIKNKSNELPEDDKTAKDKRSSPDTKQKKNPIRHFEQDNIVKDEQPLKDNNDLQQEPLKESITAMDIEETSIFGSGEAAGLDEETENELKKLNEYEKESLLQELEDINL